MGRRHIVLDQNVLRSEGLKSLIISDPSCRFIFTDEALLEMCKSPQWEETLRSSLATLSKVPSRVKMTMSVGMALRWEMEHKRSISGRLVDHEATSFIREILQSLDRSTDSANLQQMRTQMVEAHAELQAEELNHNVNKTQLVELVNVTEQFIQDHFKKALRRNSISREEKLTAIYNQTPMLLEHFFVEAGFTKGKARSFIKQRPLILRKTYLRLWRCLSWIGQGGLESFPGNKITNEGFDHDYVVVASFFNGILSKEHKVNEVYEDLAWIVAYDGRESR